MREQEVTFRQLDDLLARVRVTQQRPWYRARLLGTDSVGSPAELRVLRAVETRSVGGGQPAIREVAEELALEHSSASRAVDAVVRKGLVAKSPAVHDSRRAILSLTDAGRRALAVTTQRRMTLFVEATRGWDPDDVARLTGLLGRLADDLDSLEPDHGD